MPLTNPCDPANDCACLQANANYWLAAQIVDSGFASSYSAAASQDQSNWYQYLYWMYQYGCTPMASMEPREKPPFEFPDAPVPLTEEERKVLWEGHAEARERMIRKLMELRGLN